MSNDRPEPPAVAARAVTFTAIGLLVFVGVSLVVLHAYFGQRIRQTVFEPPTPFAGPRLQTNDADDLARLQARQRDRLSGYAWINRENGIVAIPIDEAMKRIVARGASAYAALDSTAPTRQSTGAAGGHSP